MFGRLVFDIVNRRGIFGMLGYVESDEVLWASSNVFAANIFFTSND